MTLAQTTINIAHRLEVNVLVVKPFYLAKVDELLILPFRPPRAICSKAGRVDRYGVYHFLL